MSRCTRLSLVQSPYPGSVDRAVAQAEHWIREAAKDNAQIICLQELFASQYPCQREDHAMFDLAEPIPGPTTDRMSTLAAELGVVIVAPIFERRAAGLYHNSAVVLDADGTIAGVYRKMHIPDDPFYFEKFYFTPGDASGAGNGFDTIATRYARLGVAICWDQWFPEAARLLSLAGAEILLYPTAIGWIDDEKDEFGEIQHDAWITSMRAHAIANGLYVAAPNRIGIEGRLEFWGSSFIADPNGQILSRGDHHSAGLITADCQLAMISAVRTHWPFLRDRRVDAYQ
ncbi:MAG: carbon-nitrogen hydrolase [Planctomycetota bacterium]